MGGICPHINFPHIQLYRYHWYKNFVLVSLVFVRSTVPSGEPTNVTTNVLSSSSIRITWQPPEPSEQNGDISGYTIVLTLLPTGSPYVYSVSGNTFSHIAEGKSTLV